MFNWRKRTWTLRALLGLMTMLCVSCGVITYWKHKEQQRAQQLSSLGCLITMVSQFSAFDLGEDLDRIYVNNPGDSPWTMQRDIYFFTRISYFDYVVAVDTSGAILTESDLQGLSAFRGLYVLVARNSKIEDRDIDYIIRLNRVRYADLTGNRLSDQSVGALAEMRDLRVLVLRGCEFSADGIAQLGRLRPDVRIVF